MILDIPTQLFVILLASSFPVLDVCILWYSSGIILILFLIVDICISLIITFNISGRAILIHFLSNYF